MRICPLIAVLVSAAAAALASPAWAQEGQKPSVPSSVGPGAPQRSGSAGPTGPSEPETPKNVFDSDTKLTEWLEGAKARARERKTRILIVWGTNADELGPKLKMVMSTPGNQRILDMEYQEFWAEIGTGAQAEANRALAASVNAKVTPKDMPFLSVLDEQGAVVGGRSSKKLLDPKRSEVRPTFGLLYVQDFLNEHKVDSVVVADAIQAAAKAADAKGRNLFVWFGEFEERWSDRFGALMKRPDVHSAIAAHLDILFIDLARTTDGWDYVEKLIPKPQSLPLFMVVGSDGRPIALSQPPGRDNIGFPSDASEIAQMVAAIRAGSPKMTDAQAGELSKALLAGSAGK